MTPHPHLERHESFAGLKLGALPPKHDARTLQFAKYVDAAVVLPEIPKAFDFAKAVGTWPMYANDRYGDCTCASAGHMIQAWSQAVGPQKVLPESAITAAYWATGDHKDTGRYELDVLNYWRKTGIGGDRITAYVAVEPTDRDAIRAAIYLFGGLYVGIALPLSAQGQTKWAVSTGQRGKPGSWGGHAVPYHAYNATSLTCVTWGHPQKLTYGFNDKYTQEAYAILSPDFLRLGRSPAGFDVAQLQADLGAL